MSDFAALTIDKSSALGAVVKFLRDRLPYTNTVTCSTSSSTRWTARMWFSCCSCWEIGKTAKSREKYSLMGGRSSVPLLQSFAWSTYQNTVSDHANSMQSSCPLHVWLIHSCRRVSVREWWRQHDALTRLTSCDEMVQTNGPTVYWT